MGLTSKMFEKHLWKTDILSKDASHCPVSLLKMSLSHSKNKLPGLSISGTLVENGLNKHAESKTENSLKSRSSITQLYVHSNNINTKNEIGPLRLCSLILW